MLCLPSVMRTSNKSIQKEVEHIHQALRQIHAELRDINLRLDYLLDLTRGSV